MNKPIFELKPRLGQSVRLLSSLINAVGTRRLTSIHTPTILISSPKSARLNEFHVNSVVNAKLVEKKAENIKVNSHDQSKVVNTSEYVPARFDSITCLSMETQRALKSVFKYETMSKVQDAVLSQAPITADLFVKAKTGTGKTLAFLIPAIETALQNSNQSDRTRNVSTLVVSPTRELAQQIADEARRLIQYHPFEVHSLVGGEPKPPQIRKLMSRRVDIVVGTPGRLNDLLRSVPDFADQCSYMKTLVLDEADQLLDMGFRQEIEGLMRFFPRERQTFLFSATISSDIRKIASFALRNDYVFIDTVDPNDVNTNIQVRQSYLVAPWEEHLATLRDVILKHKKTHPKGKIMMFLPTRKGTELYAEFFKILGDIEVFELQSGLTQPQRTRVSNKFRMAQNDAMLVTSDVSARGVDYPGVTLVLQVGAASSREQYIHRLGRTGRAGREGEGMLVLAPFESSFLKNLKGLPIEEGEAVKVKQDEHIQKALKRIHPSMVQEAFSAFLGYYMARCDTIGLPKSSLLQIASEFSRAFGISGELRVPASISQALRRGGGRSMRDGFGDREMNRYGSGFRGGSHQRGGMSDSRFGGGDRFGFGNDRPRRSQHVGGDGGRFDNRPTTERRQRRLR